MVNNDLELYLGLSLERHTLFFPSVEITYQRHVGSCIGLTPFCTKD